MIDITPKKKKHEARLNQSKQCECPCGRVFYRKIEEEDFRWMAHSYFSKQCSIRSKKSQDFEYVD